MKTGWLIVNHFLKTNKFSELYERLQQAAKDQGIDLVMKSGCDLLHIIGKGFSKENLPDFGLFWDKDIRLALSLENMGLRLFNPAHAVMVCDDKSLTHVALAGKVPMPDTICAPMTYDAVGYTDLSFIEKAGEQLGWPMVIKACFGSFGSQVFLAHSQKEAEKIVKTLGATPFIMQAFVKESVGRDVRLQVVGDRVVAAMLRYNEKGDFRANVTAGGSMKAYTPTEAQKEMAIKACRTLGLDFAGVDLLFGKNDEPILCEINSNAHFKNLLDCTGIDTAEAIVQHIAQQIDKE